MKEAFLRDQGYVDFQSNNGTHYLALPITAQRWIVAGSKNNEGHYTNFMLCIERKGEQTFKNILHF